MKLKNAILAGGVAALGPWAPMAGAATLNTLDGKPPIVIAHRGASGYLPEHTLGGYELAIQLGADYIEPDVQMTADGELVVMHDATLGRTTNVADLFERRDNRYRVSDFTLAEIKTLTVKPTGALAEPDSTYPGFEPSMSDPYKVPTLDEVLTFLTAENARNATSVGVYPESKTPYNSAQNQKIVATLEANGYTAPEDKVILQSFVFDSIVEMGTALSARGMDALLAQLGGVTLLGDVYGVTGADGFHSLEEIAGVADGVGVSRRGLTEDFIDSAHDLGLIVHGYTFRPLSEEEAFAQIQPVIDWGIDGIFTDYTDLGRRVVDANLAPAPVPLPAALPLLLSCLGGLAFFRRRAQA